MYKPPPDMESLTVPVTTAIITIGIAAAVYYILSWTTAHKPLWPKTKQHTAYTRKVTPVKKAFPISINSLDDFTPLGDEEPVLDVSAFFASRGNEFSVYTIDWEQEAVVLIRPVDGIDLKKYPFFREAQRLNAAEVLVLPLEQLQTVVDAISDKVTHVQQVFVYMTGRCGTTLLTRAVEASSVAQAVNEVQAASPFAQLIRHHAGRIPPVLRDEENTVALLKNVFTLLNYNLVTSDPQHRSVIFYKLLTYDVCIGELMRRAFPTAKTVFMYRNGLEVSESWSRIWARYYIIHRAIRLAVRLGLWWLFPKYPEYVTTFGDDPKFSTVRLHRSPIYYGLTPWICLMLHAAELQKNHPGHFFHAVIYYTALAREKEGMIRLLMEKLGIEWKGDKQEEDMKRMKTVFAEDSQAGTVLSLRNRTSSPGEKWTPPSSSKWYGDWEREFMSDICRQAGNEITGPDFLLPNTIS